MRKYLIVAALLCFILTAQFFTGCDQSDMSFNYPQITSSEGKAVIGETAPNFTWVGQDNVKHSLTDLRGKPVVIFTWDIACTFCTNVMLVHLNNNFKKYSDQGIAIITINDGDSPKIMSEFLKDKNYSFTILRDQPNPEYKFRSPYLLKRGNPWIILIDKNGILVDENGIFTNSIDASDKDLDKLINNFIQTQ